MLNSGKNIVIPQEQKVSLVFDTSALSELASVKRKGGGSCLDLLSYTAQLPTVNFIIIPAIIADWEMRGGASLINDDGQLEFIRVDEEFADENNRKGKNDKAYASLLATASQYRYNGFEYTVTLGSNPKLIVVETDLQRKLLNRLAAISRIQSTEERLEQITIFRHQRDIGERMMEHIAINAPINNPVYLVSRDINYFKTRNRDHTTISGYPIGTAKVLDYLYAELSTRPKELKSALGMSGIEEYKQAAIDAGLFMHLPVNQYPDGYKETGPGLYFADNRKIQGESLPSAFERAVAALNGELSNYKFPKPSLPGQFELQKALTGLPAIFANSLRSHRKSLEEILFGYQMPIIDAIVDDLAEGNAGGVVKEPTGLGKTVLMGSVIRALQVKSLVLVPKRLTANNTASEFKKLLGFSDSDIGVYHSEIDVNERKLALDKNTLIATSASVRRLVGRGLIKQGDYQYIALDEAHKMRGDVTARMIREVLVPDSIVHAWTATDKFFDGSSVGETLFGRKSHIHSTTIKEAIRAGWLSDVKNLIIRTRVEYKGEPANQELSEKAQQSLVSRAGRDEQAIAVSYNYVDPDTGIVFAEQQSIWFCAGVDHADRVARKLNELHGEGYARAVNGKSPNQQTIIDDHEAGKFKAIVNADLLIESWNNPSCSICYMLRDTLSPIIAEQTGGRAVRLDPRNPNKVAFVVNLVDEGRSNSLVFADVAEGWLITSNRELLGAAAPLAISQKKTPPQYPSVHDLDIIETERQFKEFVSTRDAERRALIVPPKTEDWLARYEIVQYLKTSQNNTRLTSFLDDAERFHRQGNEVRLGERKLDVGFRNSGPSTPFCIHKDSVDFIGSHYHLEFTVKTPDWLTRADTAHRLGVLPNRGGLKKLWDEMEAEFAEVGRAKINGEEALVGMKTHPNQIRVRALCVHVSELNRIRDVIGLKTSEWVARDEVMSMLEVSKKNPVFSDFWEKLKAEYEEKGYAHIGERRIRCGIKSTFLPAFCVHVDEVKEIAEHLKLNSPLKTDEWLAKYHAAVAIRTGCTTKAFHEYWVKMCEELAENGKVVIDGEEIRVQRCKSGSSTIVCIHKDDVEKLKKPIGLEHPERNENWLNYLSVVRGNYGLSGNDVLRPLWLKLEEQLKATGSARIDGEVIRFQYMRSYNQVIACIHIDDIPMLQKAAGIRPRETVPKDQTKAKRGAGWFARIDFLGKLGMSRSPFTQQVWGTLESNFDRDRDVTSYEGIEFKAAAAIKNGELKRLYMHESSIEPLKKALKLTLFEYGSSDWEARFEYAKLLGTTYRVDAYERLWQEVEGQYQPEQSGHPEKLPVIKGETIQCGHRRVNSVVTFFVHKKHVPILKERMLEIETEMVLKGNKKPSLSILAGTQQVKEILREADPARKLGSLGA